MPKEERVSIQQVFFLGDFIMPHSKFILSGAREKFEGEKCRFSVASCNHRLSFFDQSEETS
jgi:hypothetical protein